MIVRIECALDDLLEREGMTLVDLSKRVGVSAVNLGVLKNNRARAVRFTTLAAICDALRCAPGDVFRTVEASDTPFERASTTN